MSEINPKYERFKKIANANPKHMVDDRALKALLVHRQMIAKDLQRPVPPSNIEFLEKLIEFDEMQIKLLLMI